MRETGNQPTTSLGRFSGVKALCIPMTKSAQTRVWHYSSDLGWSFTNKGTLSLSMGSERGPGIVMQTGNTIKPGTPMVHH
eukprot:7935397-Ditylum_brightwellii.AAC.1